MSTATSTQIPNHKSQNKQKTKKKENKKRYKQTAQKQAKIGEVERN